MISAIIVAAGKGTRMGSAGDKLFLELNGCPIVAHCWRVFDQAKCIDELVLVVREGMQAGFAAVWPKFAGGACGSRATPPPANSAVSLSSWLSGLSQTPRSRGQRIWPGLRRC